MKSTTYHVVNGLYLVIGMSTNDSSKLLYEILKIVDYEWTIVNKTLISLI